MIASMTEQGEWPRAIRQVLQVVVAATTLAVPVVLYFVAPAERGSETFYGTAATVSVAFAIALAVTVPQLSGEFRLMRRGLIYQVLCYQAVFTLIPVFVSLDALQHCASTGGRTLCGHQIVLHTIHLDEVRLVWAGIGASGWILLIATVRATGRQLGLTPRRSEHSG
jgi:hypothetical protein